MNDRFFQAALDLPVRPLTGREDFFASPENAAAVALIDAFPNAFSGAVVFGEKGCGKTHLSHLFRETVLSKTGKAAEQIDFSDLTSDILEQALDHSPYLILEDISSPVDERLLFHLLNAVKSLNGFVFMTSQTAPVGWGLVLPDLITRLKALPCIEILSPGEELMQAVLIKQFADRQLTVAPEVIAYLLKNMERSFKAAAFLTKKADELSLAEHRPVTIPLIKVVLGEQC